MSKTSCVVSVLLVGLLGLAWFSPGHAGEGTTASPEAANNIGAILVKAYTFEPVHDVRQASERPYGQIAFRRPRDQRSVLRRISTRWREDRV